MAENWGRWAEGQHSVVHVALEQEHNYEIVIEAFPFCPPEFAGQVMKVGWNDLYLGKYSFTSCDSNLITFDLPLEVVTGDLNTLWFEFDEAFSPADLGLSGDQRSLAVGFTKLAFVQNEK